MENLFSILTDKLIVATKNTDKGVYCSVRKDQQQEVAVRYWQWPFLPPPRQVVKLNAHPGQVRFTCRGAGRVGVVDTAGNNKPPKIGCAGLRVLVCIVFLAWINGEARA